MAAPGQSDRAFLGDVLVLEFQSPELFQLGRGRQGDEAGVADARSPAAIALDGQGGEVLENRRGRQGANPFRADAIALEVEPLQLAKPGVIRQRGNDLVAVLPQATKAQLFQVGQELGLGKGSNCPGVDVK